MICEDSVYTLVYSCMCIHVSAAVVYTTNFLRQRKELETLLEALDIVSTE